MHRHVVATGLLLVTPVLLGFAGVSPGDPDSPETLAADGPQLADAPQAADATRAGVAAQRGGPQMLASGLVEPTSAPQSRQPAAAPRCSAVAARMTDQQAVGQLFVLGVSSRGLSSSARAALRNQWVGGVVLLGDTNSGVAGVSRVSASVNAAGRTPAGVRMLISVDQEGGTVQRLRGKGFTRIPTARSQAAQNDARLRANARTWGTQLRRAGVNANLAPVADLVPAGMERTNQPIGALRRGFGPNPQVVAAKSSAVVRGMHDANVATSVKHFPGLGRVRGNTDHVANVVDRTTTRNDVALAGFRAGVGSGTDMVMMSSATYARIDARHQALFSPIVIGILRQDLGFKGVIVSDDVGAAKALRHVPPGQRATRFLAAGGDLVINASPGLQKQMTDAVLAKSRTDKAFAASVRAKTTRVLVMKARHGLVNCTG